MWYKIILWKPRRVLCVFYFYSVHCKLKGCVSPEKSLIQAHSYSSLKHPEKVTFVGLEVCTDYDDDDYYLFSNMKQVSGRQDK